MIAYIDFRIHPLIIWPATSLRRQLGTDLVGIGNPPGLVVDTVCPR
jgi:hypothetical protein